MIILILLVIVAAVVLASYNGIVKKKNRIEAAEQELAKYQESGTAEDIDNAKKYYNAVVKEYNNAVDGFPGKLIADIFNFPKMHTDDFDEGL